MKAVNVVTHQEIFNRSVDHLLLQGRAALLPLGASAYQGNCGGCPVGNFIRRQDHTSAMEGVPVRYLSANSRTVPFYMVVGVAALARALLRSGINVYDTRTVDLLSCLQSVHDAFGTWEWRDRLAFIARQFDLSTELLKSAA